MEWDLSTFILSIFSGLKSRRQIHTKKINSSFLSKAKLSNHWVCLGVCLRVFSISIPGNLRKRHSVIRLEDKPDVTVTFQYFVRQFFSCT